MKKLAVALMVLGVLVSGFGVAWPYQSDSQADCERFRAKAVALLDQAVQAKGTAREQELVAEAEGQSSLADFACARADSFRSQGLLFVGAGVLLLVIGFVLSRKKT